MRRRRLLVLPVLLALVLTGCSGAEEPDAPVAASTSASAGPAPYVLVRTAATETVSTGSSKFSLRSTTAVGGQDVVFEGEGAYDYVKRNGQLRFVVPGPDGAAAGGGSIEQRILGPDLYLTLPQQAGVFYKLPLAAVAGTSLGGSVDPTAALQALEGVTDVEVVGADEVRGVETTHYRGTFNVQTAIAGAEGVAKTILQSTLGASASPDIPFDAHVDAEGRLVRFSQEVELAAGPQTGGQALTASTILALYDFGTVVAVTAPPGADVRDGAPLLAALKAALPTPAPAPTSPAPTFPVPKSPEASPAPVSPAPAATPAG